jgi:mannosyltransferase
VKKYLPIILAAIGVILRIIPIWAQQTWYDENFSLVLSRLPFDRMISATAGDVHPPLWYAITWTIYHLAPWLPGWAVIRLPALAASILSLFVWWSILQNTGVSDRVRLAAFGLFAVLPQQIYYAQEGRQYAMLTLLVLLTWLAILKRRTVLLTLATAAMLYLHNYSLLYAASLWLAGIVLDRSSWKRLTLSMAAGGLLFVPWVLVLYQQMSAIHGHYWMVYMTVISVFADYSHVFFANGNFGPDMFNLFVFYLCLVWTLIRSIQSRTLNRPAAILAFAPMLLAVVISVIYQPIILYRALTPSGAFVGLLLATNMDWLTEKRTRALVAAVFFLPALIVNLASTASRSIWRDEFVSRSYTAIDYINSHWQDGDLLYHADDGIIITGIPNWDIPLSSTMRVPPCGDVLGGITDLTRQAIGEPVGDYPADWPGRVWVVSAETPMNPLCEKEYLEARGLTASEPVYCMADREIVKSCVYLITK